jgi:hypothetical protein
MPKAYMMAGGKAPRKAYWRPLDSRRRTTTYRYLLTYSPPKDEEDEDLTQVEAPPLSIVTTVETLDQEPSPLETPPVSPVASLQSVIASRVLDVEVVLRTQFRSKWRNPWPRASLLKVGALPESYLPWFHSDFAPAGTPLQTITLGSPECTWWHNNRRTRKERMRIIFKYVMDMPSPFINKDKGTPTITKESETIDLDVLDDFPWNLDKTIDI